jgi:hypothetical protein
MTVGNIVAFTGFGNIEPLNNYWKRFIHQERMPFRRYGACDCHAL